MLRGVLQPTFGIRSELVLIGRLILRDVDLINLRYAVSCLKCEIALKPEVVICLVRLSQRIAWARARAT